MGQLFNYAWGREAHRDRELTSDQHRQQSGQKLEQRLLPRKTSQTVPKGGLPALKPSWVAPVPCLALMETLPGAEPLHPVL